LAAFSSFWRFVRLEKSISHFRLAKSLAVPAAVAIRNARTHERAEIYAAELEARLQEVSETQKGLERSRDENG